MKVTQVFAISFVIASLSTAAQAGILNNGDFETGDFTDWTVTNQPGGSGNWFVQGTGAGTPIENFSTPILASGGHFFADTDQTGPGSHQLSQIFNASAGDSLTLTFDAYIHNQAAVGPVGTGSSYNTVPNQHAEVLVNGNLIYSGIFASAWQAYSFDVSSALVNGANTLTFIEVDNQGFLNEGLDNIDLAGTQAVPEPITFSLFGAGFAGLLTLRRRKRG